MGIRSSTVRKVTEIIRKVCNPLVRDFHEIQRLQGSPNLGTFFQEAYSKVGSRLERDLRDYNIATGSQYKIVIFPVDGKENFLRGIPEFTVSVLLKKGDEPVICVIEAPLSYTTFYAERSYGAYLEDLGGIVRLKIKTFTDIGNTVALLNYPENQFSFRECRLLGCDSLSAAYLASGRADALLLNTEIVNPNMLLLVRLIASESSARELKFHRNSLFGHFGLCERLEPTIPRMNISGV
ncbi:inositol monophosphatase family protein [Neorickettsia helminthoeca]|nr:inositol monophosphatase family protein [Neorickettsia helminthoeca]